MMSGRASQEAYLAQQRQNARPQYMQVLISILFTLPGLRFYYKLQTKSKQTIYGIDNN